MSFDPSTIIPRLVLIARGLAFVFLVYFVPVVARDLVGEVLPGGGLVGLLRGDAAGPLFPFLVSTATFGISAAFVLLYARTREGASRPRRLLSFDRRWFSEWGRGFLLGGAAATVVVAPLFLAGVLRVDSIALGGVRLAWFLPVLLTLFVEAAREELGFRGPAQREITAAAGFPVAAIFLAGSFAIIHGGNPAVGKNALLGVFLAGVALAGLARARGDLGMVCGVHAGWNVFTAMVWSVTVSGFQLDSTLLEVSASSSAPWTGGDFGVEASVPGIVTFLILGFVTWALPERAGEPADSGRNDRAGAGADDSGSREV